MVTPRVSTSPGLAAPGDVATFRSDPTFTRASPGLAVAEQLPQIIIIINITAAGAVDRELLYIEVGNLSPPHQQQQQQQRTTTTINNNNNNQQWHVCVSPWNVGAGGRARGRARGGRRLILWTLLRQSGEAASARAKGPQRKVQKRDWCRKKCCNTFRIVFRIFFDFL